MIQSHLQCSLSLGEVVGENPGKPAQLPKLELYLCNSFVSLFERIT